MLQALAEKEHYKVDTNTQADHGQDNTGNQGPQAL
jgi:hypothetical protein